MILDAAIFAIHWVLASLTNQFPVFNPADIPAWISFIIDPIKEAYGFCDLWFNMGILIPFFVTVGVIVMAYTVYHWLHQNVAMARGVVINKDHI